MIYQFTQNGLPPDCHAERSEASVTDSSLTLRMTEERSVIDDVAPSVCERMTCSVNMYIITNKYDWRKRPPPWHVLCLSVLRRYAECIILNCFQYLRDTFLRFHVTEVHYTTPRRTWVFRERGVYSLLCVSGAPLMRVWGISRTSGDQNHHFDAKINIACASLGQKSHKLWGSTQDFAGDPGLFSADMFNIFTPLNRDL